VLVEKLFRAVGQIEHIILLKSSDVWILIPDMRFVK
jgi:hypothetical protein